MNKKKIFNGLKMMIIIFLVMMIALIAILQWKGDIIVQKVIGKIENQLDDSLHYESLHLEWFRYFPSLALRIDGLKLGPENEPFIEGGDLDIVLRLFPLFKEKIEINRLLISNARINIIKHNLHWSYEVLKKSNDQQEGAWNALVHQVNIEKSTLSYNDHDGLSLLMEIGAAKLKGMLTGNKIDADIEMQGSLSAWSSTSYKLPSAISVELSGNYKYDLAESTQEYNHWKINNEDIHLEVNGSMHKEKDEESIDASVAWSGKAEALKQFIPDETNKGLDGINISGHSEGKLTVQGKLSKNNHPHITFSSVLKNGSIQFREREEALKDILLTLSYDNGDDQSKKNSFLLANLQQGSFPGHKLNADVRIDNLDHPALTLNLEGYLPAGLLNIFSFSSGIHFQSGFFDIARLKTDGLVLKTASLATFIENSQTGFSMEKIKFTHHQDVIEITKGDLHLDPPGQMQLAAEKFSWNKANAEEVNGSFHFISDKVDYEMKGSICQGEVKSKGTITGLGQRPILDADWTMKDVEMHEVMASFENFKQTFITSENLKGKTTILAHTVIPYDAAGNILSHDVLTRAAIDIRDGELKDMKTLEDFGKYVHVDDLRDIHFNELRNYLKIEDGKVYIPVMFIQSNAINMSISGVHSFDQHILYNLKINAGQVVANKLRKLDPGKRLKPARKSGWINLYYVLSGTTSSVQYEQDQKEVLSGFEQSAALKENLRNYLVDHFGYDVYWLEPNEWEDIPEYR